MCKFKIIIVSNTVLRRKEFETGRPKTKLGYSESKLRKNGVNTDMKSTGLNEQV